MGALLRDARYVLRILRKRPSFTLATVLAIGVGIAFNLIILSVVRAVLLHSLPVDEVDRVFMLWQQDLASSRDRITISPADYLDYRDSNHVFSGLAAVEPSSFTLMGGGEPLQVEGAYVTIDLLQTLGVRPALGRGFLSGEDQSGRDREVLLSYGFWKRQFGGDSKIIGRRVWLEPRATVAMGTAAPGGTFTVIGVLPSGLNLPLYATADLWVPLQLDRTREVRNVGGLRVVGRLKSGIGPAQATAEMNVIRQRLEAQYPRHEREQKVALIPLREEEVGDVRPALLALGIGAGLLLLIVCANVASMLLVRAAECNREVKVRIALGASRARLLGQSLTESLVLGLVGAGVGLILAEWGIRIVATYSHAEIPRLNEVQIDPTVMGWAACFAVVTAVLFGLAPALSTARFKFHEALRQRGSSRSRGRLQNMLVAGEVVLAFVLSVSTALVVKSLVELERVDMGFDPRQF